MNKSKILIVSGIFLVIILVSGYFYKEKSISNDMVLGTNTSNVIKIGGAIGLSGICSSWGEGELKAIQLAVKETNDSGGIDGKQIKLYIEDTMCDPRGTVDAVQKLINIDKVEAIIGPTWGDSFYAGYTIGNKNKVVMIGSSLVLKALQYNNVPIDYAFSTWFPVDKETRFISEYAAKNVGKRFATVNDNDPFGAVFAKSFKENATLNGIQIIREDRITVGQDDFRTIIVRLKTLNLDGVFISFQAPVSQAKFQKQAKELGLNIKILNPSDIEDPSFLKDFGTTLEGIIYAYPKDIGSHEEFYKKYKTMFGIEPSGSSLLNAYDAGRVLIAGLREHYTNGTDLNKAIENIDISGTVTHRLKFDQNHELTDVEYDIKTVHNGKFEIVK